MIGHDWLVRFSAVLWPAVSDHLWQATIVAGMCLLTLPAFRNAGAKSRHLLWAMAFVRFAIPQSLVLFVADRLGFQTIPDSPLGTGLQTVSVKVAQVTQPSAMVAQQPAGIGTVTSGHAELFCTLTVVWIAGCAFLLGRWWFRQHRLAICLGKAAPETGSNLVHTIELLNGRLGFSRRTRLRIMKQGSEPGVYGVRRPFLVLPEEMPQQLSRAELEAVLAHELVHVARRDNLWSNLQMILCCIFWFYPVVWLLDKRLIAERERICDERVIEVFRNSQAYASGLVKVTSIGLGFRVAGVSPMAGSNLKRRIEDMKRTNKKSALTPKILLSLMAALAVFLCLAAGPFQEGIAQNAQSALKIENSGNSPLQIVSAAVADISLAPRITAQVAAQLVHPRIVVKNNSGQAVSVYVLEFRKPGSPALYFNRVDAGLAPKGTDIIEKNEFLWTAGEEVPGTGVAWAIRIDAVRFKDGNVVTLHGSPIPPPPGTWELSSAAPATKLRDPINVGIKLPESKLIKRVEPVYPELALKKRVQGRVILMINVDEEGNVTDAKVQDGSPVLNDAALAAVKQWKYSPTFLNGKPVPVIATVTVDFRLK